MARLISIAGLASEPICTDGVLIGKAVVPLAANAPTSVMLTPVKASQQVDSSENATDLPGG